MVSMRFARAHEPTEAELRAWAAEAGAAEPVQDWDLVLFWGMEPGRLRVFVELAADPALPNQSYFLYLLYSWVAYAAGREDFDARRPQYDQWLDRAARGVRDPAVKRWRHGARRIFQGVEPLDAASWSAALAAERGEGTAEERE